MALSPGPALEDSLRQCLRPGIPKIVDGLLQLSDTPTGVSARRYSTYSAPHLRVLTYYCWKERHMLHLLLALRPVLSVRVCLHVCAHGEREKGKRGMET